MDYQKTYTDYKRPPLSPPPYLFGIVWPFLYILIFVSFGFIFRQAIKGEVSASFLAPFIINLLANGLFTYFQFKLKNNFLATVDILVVLATIIWTMLVAWSGYHWITYLQIPYLAWVTFATYLQIGVTVLNKTTKS
jgi:tryptophan-rich sensory protein